MAHEAAVWSEASTAASQVVIIAAMPPAERAHATRPLGAAIRGGVALMGALLAGCGGDERIDNARSFADPFSGTSSYALVDPARALAVPGAAAPQGSVAIAVAREFLDDVLVVAFDSGARLDAVGSLAVGQGPRDIAAADLDGDGALDLVTADAGASTISILRRAPGEAFGPAVPVPLAAAPLRVAAADLTGDGADEVIVASGVGNATSISVLTPQAGSLVPLGPALAVPGASGFSAGDLDGNGSIDLAVVAADGRVIVATQDGSGGLSPSSIEACTAPAAVAIADLDRDGNADLVVACQGEIAVIYGPAGESARRASLGPAMKLVDVVAADLDGDSVVDVAAVDVLAHEAAVWLAPGAGGPAAPFRHPVTRGPIAVRAADADGDGDEDLIVLGYEERRLEVLLGASN